MDAALWYRRGKDVPERTTPAHAQPGRSRLLGVWR